MTPRGSITRDGEYAVILPWPSNALKSNARVHWAEKARETAKHREWARLAVLGEEGMQDMPGADRATIFIEYYPPSKRGDIHNVASSLKAYIDGIADGLGVDDKGFRVDYPTVWAGSGKPGKVVFRVLSPLGAGE